MASISKNDVVTFKGDKLIIDGKNVIDQKFIVLNIKPIDSTEPIHHAITINIENKEYSYWDICFNESNL